jgi:hypothetical protein
MFWIQLGTNAPNARRSNGGISSETLLLAGQLRLDLAADVADPLDGLLHSRSRAPSLLGLIDYFVLFPTRDLDSAPGLAREWSFFDESFTATIAPLA